MLYPDERLIRESLRVAGAKIHRVNNYLTTYRNAITSINRYRTGSKSYKEYMEMKEKSENFLKAIILDFKKLQIHHDSPSAGNSHV